jgi:anti-sigma-K factor RskA
MISHDEASDLLGAYALDAVDGEEHTELEAHLATCPRCRAELDGLREVAAALGNTVETPPEGLWSGIASRLPEREEQTEAPPMPALDPEGRSPFRTAAPASGRRRRNITVTTVVGIAVAAAAVAAVLGIGLVRADNRVSNLQSAAVASGVTAALRAPGHQLVDLTGANHAQLAQFVVVPDGRGYLVSSQLPTLHSGDTYQLWGIVGSQPISLGLLGGSPNQAAFTMAGSVRPSRLSITSEPAGGTIMPTGAVVASGTV